MRRDINYAMACKQTLEVILYHHANKFLIILYGSLHGSNVLPYVVTGIVCSLPHLMLCPLRAILEPHAHAMTTIIDPSVREQMPTCCLLLSLAARWIASTSERC